MPYNSYCGKMQKTIFYLWNIMLCFVVWQIFLINREIIFAFVSTKAVLVRKSRQTFGTHKPKAPLCKGNWRRRRLRDCFTIKFCFVTILPSCFASHLPLHKGGVLPPDSTPKRCNTLYLAEKSCEKEYEQNCSYSFCLFRQVKPALWKTPLGGLFWMYPTLSRINPPVAHRCLKIRYCYL